jgi:hypothetical protein
LQVTGGAAVQRHSDVRTRTIYDDHRQDLEGDVAQMQWVRLQTAVDCPLRRGAWYRVVSLTKLEVVVDVRGQAVSVARPLVELRTVPPREWTVVRAAEGRGPANLQSGCVVCPNCQHRAVLPFTRVLKLPCPRCNQLFPIAWDEGYLRET